MDSLPPSQAPSALVAPASDSLLETLLASRLAPDSDPELSEVLCRAWKGSPRFRETLTALFTEQPKVRLRLVKIDSESFGFLTLSGDPALYPLQVSVQWRGVLQHRDLPEPWLASILFALLEVTRKDSVIPKTESRYQFDNDVRDKMWVFQAAVREELRAYDPQRYRKLAKNGELLYYNFFPPTPRRPGMSPHPSTN